MNRKNESSYLSHLKGDKFQEKLNAIDYKNVTLNLEDYFLEARVVLKNGRLNSFNITKVYTTFKTYIDLSLIHI